MTGKLRRVSLNELLGAPSCETFNSDYMQMTIPLLFRLASGQGPTAATFKEILRAVVEFARTFTFLCWNTPKPGLLTVI
jgi:hypothetical protein